MKKYFVTIDGVEYEEKFVPRGFCDFCGNAGTYMIEEDGAWLCEECLKKNYKGKIRVEK